MPPKKHLSAEEIAVLTKWVKDGAAWPEVDAGAVHSRPNPKYDKLRKEHWAWQPFKKHAPRTCTTRPGRVPKSTGSYLRSSRQQVWNLCPTQTSSHSIRRVTFDLTGLPPHARRNRCFPRRQLVWRPLTRSLIACWRLPAYGERWGRHWLDVARYGESTGSSRNVPFPHAWRYRDYVIDAFACDKPYNTFIREQIAGDLIPANSPSQRDQQQIATGFLAVGVKDVNQRFKVRFIMDNVDEQIDAVSRSFLAMTVSCARCHDHKFDPIPTTDYYALAGIFRSTDLCAGLRNKMGGGGLDYYDTSMIISLGEDKKSDPNRAEKITAATQAFQEARKEFEAIRGTPKGLALAPNGQPTQRPFRLKMVRLQNELLALTDPANGKVALGVRDAKAVGDTEIRVRGEAENLGPIVPRGFLSVLRVPDVPKDQPKAERAARAGAVARQQSEPAHPARDHQPGLAASVRSGTGKKRRQFRRDRRRAIAPGAAGLIWRRGSFDDGWSVKKLIRRIVLSRAYRPGLGSSRTPISRVDPANRLVWRHSPRRLDAEEIRDAMLAAAGTLDLDRPEASPAKDLKVMELPNNGPLARRAGRAGSRQYAPQRLFATAYGA